MKIAFVHDYLKEYGGAERVLETLHNVWPSAPVYTSVYLPKFLGPHRKRLSKWDIRPSFLQNIPLKGKLISPFRLIAPLIFKSLDLRGYDVVIVSAAGTYTSPNFVRTDKNTLHVCYYHTPPRYLYGYPTAAPWQSIWWRKILFVLGQVPMYFLRKLDIKAAQRPDIIIANSQEVQSRIKKFYKRDAVVIYPPVDIPQKIPSVEKQDFYLAGGRLARPKRVDLAIKAANELKLPLKIFGRDFQNYAGKLKEMAGPTVEFLGEIADEEKWKLMAEAKGFIFPAEFEDFGITPVEAMAVGTGVIALRSGGVKETVVEGKTGIFFDKPNAKSLIEAIKKYQKANINKETCRIHAQTFAKERFIREIKKIIKENRKK